VERHLNQKHKERDILKNTANLTTYLIAKKRGAVNFRKDVAVGASSDDLFKG